MLKRIFLLRRLLLCAGIFSGLLIFWLPAHEVFEGPKSVGFLIYSSLLFAVSLPLFPSALAKRGLKAWFSVAASLLGISVLSLLSAWTLLPSNILLCIEKLAPMLAAVLAAFVFVLETPQTRQRVLFSLLASHALMAFYGLIQILDQTIGQSAHIPIDLIRWTSFGESRVYSTLGNPDYMAAHITVFLPLWLALPWRDRRVGIRAALSAAAAALFILPLLVLLGAYGLDMNLWGAVLSRYPSWALCAAGLFVLCRKVPLKELWIGFAYLLALLVIAAQGRAAYLGLGVSALVTLGMAIRLGGKDILIRHRDFFRNNLIMGALGVLVLCSAYFLRMASPQNSLLQIAPVQSALRVTDSLVERSKDFFVSSSDATNVRRFYYKAAIRMGLEHPLLGIGFGNHALFTAAAQSEVWKGWESSGNNAIMFVEPHVELYTHNDFLQNFAETGILGLAAFLLFWAFIIVKSWRLSASGWNEPRGRIGVGLLGLAAAFLTSAMLNFPWRVLATQQLCWLAFALLAVSSTEKEALASPGAALERQNPVPWGLIGTGTLIAFTLALWPTRWFYASSLFKEGNLGRDQNRYADAANFYQKAVDVGLSGTQRVELYLYLGSMENMLSRPDLAEEWFNKGVAIYPNFIEALYNLGYTSMVRFNTRHLETDRQKSIDYFNRVLDIDPRYMSALNNLGNLYYSQRDFVHAAATYERVIRFSPDTLEPRYNLGVTDLLLQKRSEGEEQLNQALRIKPGYAPALTILQQLKKMPAGARLMFK